MKPHLVKKRITDRNGRTTHVWVKMNDTFKIPRSQMPQVRSSKLGDFKKHLTKNKITFYDKSLKASDLKPTQKHINQEKVKTIPQMDKTALNKPILVSKDGYVLDGHHRWAYRLGRGEKIKATVISLDIKKLIPFIKRWSGVEYSTLTERKKAA